MTRIARVAEVNRLLGFEGLVDGGGADADADAVD
jgi:hypothetical protein